MIEKIKLGIFGILLRDGKFLMGKCRLDDTFGVMWGHPGGGIELGEAFDTALIREFAEEVGIKISIYENYLATHEYITEDRHVVLIFRQVLSDEIPKALDGFTEIGWFSFQAIKQLAA